MSKQKTTKRRHWYMHFIGECPVCGRTACYRERRYRPKPKNKRGRYQHLSDYVTYCGCLEGREK